MSNWDLSKFEKDEQDRQEKERKDRLERHNAEVENERAAAAARKAQLDKEEQDRFQRRLEEEREQKSYEELKHIAEESRRSNSSDEAIRIEGVKVGVSLNLILNAVSVSSGLKDQIEFSTGVRTPEIFRIGMQDLKRLL
jgi:ATPase subunit of ABC transporter with duplicated ATPase domains